jgi:hypothetical protein
VQFSVQSNHIHLLAEAEDRAALTRGMQALTIRVALAINRVLARRGRVFSERYHARSLRSPLEVRRALLYVLKNHRHHLAARGASLPPWHLDPCSSAPDFRDWQPGELLLLAQHGASRTALEPCTVCARTFLLRSGWHRHGLLRLDEDPA